MSRLQINWRRVTWRMIPKDEYRLIKEQRVAAKEEQKRIKLLTKQLTIYRRPAGPTPKEIKLGTKGIPTSKMTADQLAVEARTDRKLLRAVGWSDAAAFHPQTMHHQYKRVTEATGRLPYGSNIWAMGVTLAIFVVAVVGAFVAPLGPGGVEGLKGGELSEEAKAALPYFTMVRNAVLIIVPGMGLFAGGLLGFATRAWKEYAVAYAAARITQIDEDDGAVAILEKNWMRMTVFDRHEESLFSGNDEHSGFIDGRLALVTRLDIRTCSEDDLYKPGNVWRPTHGNIGVSAHRLGDFYHRWENAGRLKAFASDPNDGNGSIFESTLFQIALLYGGAIGLAVLLLLLGIDNTVAMEYIQR